MQILACSAISGSFHKGQSYMGAQHVKESLQPTREIAHAHQQNLFVETGGWAAIDDSQQYSLEQDCYLTRDKAR